MKRVPAYFIVISGLSFFTSCASLVEPTPVLQNRVVETTEILENGDVSDGTVLVAYLIDACMSGDITPSTPAKYGVWKKIKKADGQTALDLTSYEISTEFDQSNPNLFVTTYNVSEDQATCGVRFWHLYEKTEQLAEAIDRQLMTYFSSSGSYDYWEIAGRYYGCRTARDSDKIFVVFGPGSFGLGDSVRKPARIVAGRKVFNGFVLISTTERHIENFSGGAKREFLERCSDLAVASG